jgi:hypothetical protein
MHPVLVRIWSHKKRAGHARTGQRVFLTTVLLTHDCFRFNRSTLMQRIMHETRREARVHHDEVFYEFRKHMSHNTFIHFSPSFYFGKRSCTFSRMMCGWESTKGKKFGTLDPRFCRCEPRSRRSGHLKTHDNYSGLVHKWKKGSNRLESSTRGAKVSEPRRAIPRCNREH